RRVLLARIHSQAELADGGAARRVPQLWVLGQVPYEDDSVDVCHGSGLLLERMFPAYPVGWTVSAGRTSGRRTAICRMAPSVILRTRVISSSVSALASKWSRW